MNSSELKLNNINIVLINSDFVCGFEIKRNKLYNILKKKNITVSYEPDIYAAVNMKFYYNKSYEQQLGICHCEKKCKGKGDGLLTCKKITISIFQSGSIIITGAKSNIQKNEAYNFINKIIKNNYRDIYKVS